MDQTKLRLDEVKAVFFDFGDTLARLSPSREELFRRAALSIGLELEIEAVRRAYQIIDFHHKYSSVLVKDRDRFYHDYNELLCEALGISSHYIKLAPALLNHFKTSKRWELMEDAAEVLSRLGARPLPLALVANWDSNLSSLTERLGIRQHFSAIVASQSAGVEKPDAAIFRIALDELSLSAETDRVLYVGNEYRADVLGARAAGLVPVLIDRNQVYKHMDGLRFTSLLEWLESME
jgi:putative hydrolase of the HAD superfamily